MKYYFYLLILFYPCSSLFAMHNLPKPIKDLILLKLIDSPKEKNTSEIDDLKEKVKAIRALARTCQSWKAAVNDKDTTITLIKYLEENDLKLGALILRTHGAIDYLKKSDTNWQEYSLKLAQTRETPKTILALCAILELDLGIDINHKYPRITTPVVKYPITLISEAIQAQNGYDTGNINITKELLKMPELDLSIQYTAWDKNSLNDFNQEAMYSDYTTEQLVSQTGNRKLIALLDNYKKPKKNFSQIINKIKEANVTFTLDTNQTDFSVAMYGYKKFKDYQY